MKHYEGKKKIVIAIQLIMIANKAKIKIKKIYIANFLQNLHIIVILLKQIILNLLMNQIKVKKKLLIAKIKKAILS